MTVDIFWSNSKCINLKLSQHFLFYLKLKKEKLHWKNAINLFWKTINSEEIALQIHVIQAQSQGKLKEQ